MQKNTRLAINAAAWFFVGDSDDVAHQSNVPINVPFRIGRNPDVDLQLQCASSSGLHAEIIEEDGELWVCDLNSTNGTFLNGERIKSRARLQPEDTVQFGTTVFQITHEDDVRSYSEPALNSTVPDTANSQNERFERLFTDGVVPFYQPVVRIDKNELFIIGYEVLGRSKLFGLRTPAQMFAAASRLEMEAELSRVLRKRGIEVADKVLPEDFALFVNTHPAELACDGLEESLFEIRESHPSRPIMLEVHESILNRSENFVKLRTTLQNLNIQMAFHDFGAGQVRLAELCELIPNVVKLDVRLVRGIDKASAQRQKFVASLVSMFNNLGITPLAECIEQPGERDTLQQLGIQLGQGFLFGRPSPITDCYEKQASTSTAKIPMVQSFLSETSNQAPEPKDAQWLLEQPSHLYTLQVLSAISEQRARDFIATQDNPEEFAIFSKEGKTRTLYIVVQGLFPDHSTAKSIAEANLQATVSPWIRMLSSIHAEIESNKASV